MSLGQQFQNYEKKTYDFNVKSMNIQIYHKTKINMEFMRLI